VTRAALLSTMLVVVAGCGGANGSGSAAGAPTTTAPTTTASGGAGDGDRGAGATATPSGKMRVECPTGDALIAAARAHFQAPTGELTVACVAVFTDRAYLVFDGTHASPTDYNAALVTVLVDPSTDTAVWSQGVAEFTVPTSAVEHLTDATMTAVDLDGDGRDEIVTVAGSAAAGQASQSLAVYTVGADRLVPAGEVPYSYDNRLGATAPAARSSCATTWTLVGGPDGSKRLELIVTAAPVTTANCLTPGRHVLAWNGKALVEVP